MIGATYSVLAPFTGSAHSLTTFLSSVDRVTAESSPTTRQRQSFSRWRPLIHLPTCQFSLQIRHRELQKTIQYPETRSVQ